MTSQETNAPAIYVGAVMHRRFKPRAHRFRYRGFWLLVDVDRLPEMSMTFLSHNRSNLLSLFDRDHGDGSDQPLGDQARALLAARGIDIGGGSITLLCMPRILGYSFNPLSIYFCRHADGTLAALIYEVHNTFKQRHSYVLSSENERTYHSCAKQFYVSPFLEMDLTYDFAVAAPGERLAIGIRVRRGGALLMSACLAANRLPLTDTVLLRCFIFTPFASLKVIVAIHWEAARMWWKGFRLASPAPVRAAKARPSG